MSNSQTRSYFLKAPGVTNRWRSPLVVTLWAHSSIHRERVWRVRTPTQPCYVRSFLLLAVMASNIVASCYYSVSSTSPSSPLASVPHFIRPWNLATVQATCRGATEGEMWKENGETNTFFRWCPRTSTFKKRSGGCTKKKSVLYFAGGKTNSL